MAFDPGPDLDRLLEALDAEARGQRALLRGDDEGAAPALREAADRYRASWEAAGPRSFGRLIGMLKAAVLSGDAQGDAAYARGQVAAGDSPPSHYVLAIAALVDGDDEAARSAAEGMREGSPPFARAAGAIAALADRDPDAYALAVGAIVADFEAREEHLTGVPIADTALMLERLAAARGLASHPSSSLLPR